DALKEAEIAPKLGVIEGVAHTGPNESIAQRDAHPSPRCDAIGESPAAIAAGGDERIARLGAGERAEHEGLGEEGHVASAVGAVETDVEIAIRGHLEAL